METKINSIELAAELAHTRTFYESGDICNNEDDMYEIKNEESTVIPKRFKIDSISGMIII